jgi:hypothetical protein
LIEEAKNNTERIEKKIKGYAVVPSRSDIDPVMTYELTLSVKNRKKS